MGGQNHSEMLQWLEEAIDGELDSSRSEVLEAHLSECAACRQENESVLRLHGMLSDDRVTVAPGFAARVMKALPVEAWQVRPARSFRLAMVLLLVFASSSVLLLSASGVVGSAPFTLFGSVADLLATAALAGAGLLGATWQGVGLVLRDLLTGSPTTFIGFAAALVGIHLLLWRLLRPRQKARASSD